jgi:CheY-like chemotaxis protein
MTSHELRTPLSTILGWTEILLRRNTQESMKEGLAAIDRSTRMQAQLIDDLLDMTRIATGKLKLNLQVVSVGETINEVIRANLPAAAAKNLTLEEVPLDMEMFAKADPERLAQIFSNIISNAIKFTPEGGSITIQAHASSSRQIEVKISDTGEGIDPPMLKAIFQRFRQVNSSLSRKHGGLGLGLAIAKELVESHGGRIEASSAGLGCGSQFTITLPSVDFNYPKPPQPSSSQEETKPLTDMQILVVDDDEETRTILRLMLLEAGAKVTIAPSASKALELLKAFAPDIVLSDIGMPDVDGYELMRRIREIHPHICAVALTAFATAEDRLKAIDAGFDDFLAKPVDSTRLIGAIMRIMPHK